MVFQEQLLEVISTTDQKIPSSPQIKIDNPLDDDIFINGIELILTSEFARKGKLKILINEVAVFSPKQSQEFFNYSKFPIPLGKILRRSNDIQVFAWNDSDSNLIKISMNLFLSSELQPFNSQAVPLDKSVSNKEVSDIRQEFFEDRLYFNETLTKLIDMEAYPKLILLMISDGYVSGATVLFGGAPILDGDLATQGDTETITQSTSPEDIAKIDFGSIATRVPAGRVTHVSNPASTYDLKLEVSDDNSIWSVVDTVSSSTSGTRNLLGTSQAFRYLKITGTYTGGSVASNTFRVNELFDNNLFGGLASISFEVFDGISWIEYISASALGTIINMGIATRTIGDVIADIANENFAKPLPSTQTDFRIKLIISGGGINLKVTGVKIG